MRPKKSQNWHGFVSHAYVDPPYSDFMDSTRQKWNDARMDEFAARTEENFKEVRKEIRDTRTELRAELHGEVRGLREEMNGRFASLEAKLDRRFDVLFGALATGFVGAVVSHFLG